MSKEDKTIIHNNAVEIRKHNKRITVFFDEENILDIRFEKINEKTVEIKGKRDIAAYSIVNNKGVLETGIKIEVESFLDICRAIENYQYHQNKQTINS